MSATFFHIVNEHVARNPVARAVQSAKLAAAIREFQLQLYYLADDTPQNGNLPKVAGPARSKSRHWTPSGSAPRRVDSAG